MSSKLIDNPKALIAIAFALGLSASPIISVLRKLITKKHKPPKEDKVYVGIEIGGTNFSVGIGIPHYDEYGRIGSFSMRSQMTGRTDANP
jgi:hypothetical protein